MSIELSTPVPAPDTRIGVRTCVELRVHGVAGASPVNMLELNPCRGPGAAEDEIVEWRQPHPQPQLRAWSWGSLTSGRWYQAIYLVLLPFMLANVAGWMLPPMQVDPDDAAPPATRSLRIRLAVLAVRTVGLLISIIFVLWVQLVVSDLLAYQALVRGRGWPVWTMGLGTAATALVLAALVLLTRIRRRKDVRDAHGPWLHWFDPAGYASLRRGRQHPMWNSPAINVVLRRLHLSAGLAIIALLAAWPTADLEQPWRQVGAATTWTASAGLAIVLALLAWISLADGRPAGGDLPHRGEVHSRACRPERGRGLPPIGLVRWASPLLPLLAVALAACSAAGVTARWIEAHPVLPALRGANLWMTIAVLVGAGLVLLCSLGRTEAAARQRANAPGILLLAAAAGSTLGAGVAEQASRLLQSWCPTEQECLTIGEHVDWLAVTLVMVLAAAVLAVVAWNLVRIYGRQADWRVAARNLTDRGSWINGLLGALGALATAAGVLWIVIRGGLPPTSVIPTQLAAAVVIVLLLPIVVAAVVRLRRLHPLAPILVVVVAAAVAGAVATGQSTQLLGIPLPPTSFREFALTVAVVLPTVAVLRKIYTGLRSQEIRRTTGVLWDVGTFWPRWFHPFAPPAYSDRAVTHLIERIETRADANEDVLLVAAHSQGSIIAGTAILDAAPSRPVALLTFGSPWRHLYTEFFPAYFGRAATCELAQRLPGRWRNLFRVTDPIGGPVGLPDVDATPMSDPSHRIHSNYWLESQYHDETRRLDAALPP